MKYLILLAVIFHIHLGASAQNEYSILLIPKSLTENANVVLRNSHTHYNIKNEGSFSSEVKFAITILNTAGDKHAQLVLDYDKLHKVKNIEGKLYDAMGNKVRSLKKSELSDFSATSDATFADDARIKAHNFSHHTYPYTVEYEYEINYDGILFFPTWVPMQGENFSVQQGTLKVSMPALYDIRTKSFGDLVHTSSSDKDHRYLEWQIKDMPVQKYEPYSTPWYENTASVFLAPVNFKLQDYSGNMSDWNAMGQFMYKLNEGRNELPSLVKSKVKELTAGLQNDRDKIAVLYKFIQSSTRYISIQLGIGGWQTFPANYVASNGYGDCKALTNYMHSLLKEAGIPSSFALIKAGDHASSRSFLPDFASNQFNHVILCVPQGKDSIWLECTSESSPAGYLGSFTSNRNTLLYNEKGGRLTQTPKYSAEENLQVRTLKASLDPEGNLSMKVKTDYHAEQQDRIHRMVNALSREKIADYLKEYLQIPSYEVIGFDYKQINGRLPSITEQLELKANNYGRVTGSRIFLLPNILNRSGIRLPDQSKRKTPVFISSDYTDIDSIEYQVPEGYEAELVPKNISLTTPFGKFITSYEFKSGKLFYYRYLQTSQGKFPSEKAIAFKEFYDAIYSADHAKLVFKKK